MEIKRDVDEQRNIIKGFIPDVEDYIQALKEQNVDNTLINEYERASEEAQKERVRQAQEEGDKKVIRDKENPYSRRATTERLREVSEPYLEEARKKKEAIEAAKKKKEEK